MKDTHFVLPEEKLSRLATVYAKSSDGGLTPIPYSRPSEDFFSGGGGLSSTAAKEKATAKQAKTSLLGSLLNFPMPHLNEVVDGLDLGDEFRHFPTSDVPTLLLTGTLDGRTYIEAQKEATKVLTNLTQVIVKKAVC
jgi:hypothetical protein